jgi:hypothetical protein
MAKISLAGSLIRGVWSLPVTSTVFATIPASVIILGCHHGLNELGVNNKKSFFASRLSAGDFC